MTPFYFVSQYSINECKWRLVSLEEVSVLKLLLFKHRSVIKAYLTKNILYIYIYGAESYLTWSLYWYFKVWKDCVHQSYSGQNYQQVQRWVQINFMFLRKSHLTSQCFISLCIWHKIIYFWCVYICRLWLCGFRQSRSSAEGCDGAQVQWGSSSDGQGSILQKCSFSTYTIDLQSVSIWVNLLWHFSFSSM